VEPPSKHVVNMLVSSLGYTFGTDIFIGAMPTEIGECAVVTDTGGVAPDLTFGGSTAPLYERPTVQVLARAARYDTAYAKLENIKEVLHGRQGEVQEGVKYTVIEVSSDIARLGQDENSRWRFTLNFSLQRSRE